MRTQRQRLETSVAARVEQIFFPCLCDEWSDELRAGQAILDEESIPQGAEGPQPLRLQRGR